MSLFETIFDPQKFVMSCPYRIVSEDLSDLDIGAMLRDGRCMKFIVKYNLSVGKSSLLNSGYEYVLQNT
jgi:hypothetical protein